MRVRQAPTGVFVELSDTIVPPGQLLGLPLSAAAPGLAEPQGGAAVGELIRFATDVADVQTGTVTLTIGALTTSIQCNPAGADLSIDNIVMEAGQQVYLRVSRVATQRVIIVPGAGVTNPRTPNASPLVLRANDGVRIRHAFGAPLVEQVAWAPGQVAPSQALVAAAPTLFFGGKFNVRQTYAAGGGGAPDDVTLVSAALPFPVRITGVAQMTSTGVVGQTVQLRTAAGGGGSALSSALAAAAAGTTYNSDSVTRTLAANASVFLRRSDSGIAGTILIECERN